MSSKNHLLRGLPPMHPGELLRECVLPALKRPKAEIAGLLQITPRTLNAIVSERKPITPAMALRIGKLCGNGPELWLNLQRSYDLAQAEREVDVSKIPTLQAEPV